MNLGPDGQAASSRRCRRRTSARSASKQNLLLKQSKAGKKYVQCPDAKCKFIADADESGAR